MRHLILLFTLLFATAAFAENRYVNNKIASAISMGGTFNSSIVDIKNLNNVSVEAVWYQGSTPIGALNLQGSNQVVNSTTSVASWTDLSTSVYNGSVAVSGNTGSYLYNVTNVGFRWLRAVYTRTSGSGTIDLNFTGKGQ